MGRESFVIREVLRHAARIGGLFVVPALSAGLAATAVAGGACTPQMQTYPGAAGLELPSVSMIAHDFGAGARLFLAGDFHVAGGLNARNAAQLSDTGLGPVGLGLGAGHSGDAYSTVVCVHDGAVYFGGRFDHAGGGGLDSPHIARWTGSAWQAIGASAEVLAIVSINGGLYYAKSGGTWNAGLAQLENGPVHDAVVFDDGSGDRIVAVGDFKISSGQSVRRVAWSVPATIPQGEWTEVGGGARNGPVYDALVHVGSLGEQTLYIAGGFDRVGDTEAAGLAAWEGSAWSIPGLIDGVAHTMAFFDDGSGEALYIGGEFTAVSGVPAQNIARLRNGAWEAIGQGASGPVLSMAVLDDGAESSLCISGDFLTFDGQPSVRFVRIFACASAGGCPGDTNGDGVVNFTDLNAALTAYNSVEGDLNYNPGADIDADGDVDFADLNVVVSSFNSAC